VGGLSGQCGQAVEVGKAFKQTKQCLPRWISPPAASASSRLMPLAMAKSMEAMRLQKTQPRSPGQAARLTGTPGRAAVSAEVTYA
jgi:hypothetical protein